jgi:hypothetical protein
MAKLSPSEIKNRRNNIKNIRTDYIQKIKTIGGREKTIIANALKKSDQIKLAGIRQALKK